MGKINFLKIVPPRELPVKKVAPLPDPLSRFSGIVLNLTSKALGVVQHLARKEIEKKSPSTNIMEDYYLLYHYLDFIRRLCTEKRAE